MNAVRSARAALRRRPMLADGILAAVLTTLCLAEVVLIGRAPDAAPIWLSLLLVLPSTVPLVWRRRLPLCAAACVIAALSFSDGGPFAALTPAIALYSATTLGRRPWVIPTVAVFYFAPIGLLAQITAGEPDRVSAIGSVITLATIWVLPLVVGVVVRTARWRRRRRARAVEQEARRAVSDERLRIARELHDVVAHHVSLMGVQAGAARIVLDGRNERATAALSAIEESSRHAVTELHHLLGVLRSDGEPDDPTPQPGIDELPVLVDRAGRAGLVVEGEPRPLPRTVDVAAYRVVQEALTNSRKHSGGATTHVRVRYRSDALEIEVVDTGTGPGPRIRPTIGGHGLVGMRERVVQSGGQLRTGPRPTGGFGVHAVFPLDAVVPADGVMA